MSDLTHFRDHCRKMAEAAHRLDCKGWQRKPVWQDTDAGLIWVNAPPTCGGCSTVAERALFRQLAREIEDYLTGEGDEPADPTDDDVPLFGGTT